MSEETNNTSTQNQNTKQETPNPESDSSKGIMYFGYIALTLFIAAVASGLTAYLFQSSKAEELLLRLANVQRIVIENKNDENKPVATVVFTDKNISSPATDNASVKEQSREELEKKMIFSYSKEYEDFLKFSHETACKYISIFLGVFSILIALFAIAIPLLNHQWVEKQQKEFEKQQKEFAKQEKDFAKRRETILDDFKNLIKGKENEIISNLNKLNGDIDVTNTKLQKIKTQLKGIDDKDDNIIKNLSCIKEIKVRVGEVEREIDKQKRSISIFQKEIDSKKAVPKDDSGDSRISKRPTTYDAGSQV